jgi:hypothetical protein
MLFLIAARDRVKIIILLKQKAILLKDDWFFKHNSDSKQG